MGCILAAIALFFPRIVILLVYVFSDYLEMAYQTWIWPVLGFLFLPLTTLAYAFAWHQGDGDLTGLGIAAIVVAVLIDLGLLGGSSRARPKPDVKS
jgi:hypothetical protein